MRWLSTAFEGFLDEAGAGRDGPVALAVSGGSDSLAMLHLANGWARTCGRTLVVLTIDHGVRAASRDEAEGVARKAKALGWPCETLTFKPERKGQQALRRLRHARLAEAARRAGASALCLGHTLDDRCETFLIRARRKGDALNMAAPQPASVSPAWPGGRGLVLLRPLLCLRRAELRAYLVELGESWADDPTNAALEYERVAMRGEIAALGDTARARLEDAVARLGLLKAVHDRALAGWIETRTEIDAFGLITADIAGLDRRKLEGLLPALTQTAAGTARRPPAARLARVADALATRRDETRETLGGAWLQRRGETLLIGRDPGEARGAVGESWDGRFVRAEAPLPDTLAPVLVRATLPPDRDWRPLAGERLAHLAETLRLSARLEAYQTRRVSPVHT